MNDQIVCPHCKKSFPPAEGMSHQLDELKKQVEEKVSKELKEKESLELISLKKQLREKEAKEDEFRKQELQLREANRKLEDAKKEMELEVQRKLDAERRLLEEKLSKQLQENFAEREKAKDIYIENLKKSLEDAKRRADVGSQQLQGETLELALEEQLSAKFPADLIKEVKKGSEGGDILHTVRDTKGIVAGSILWETKKTKNWSNGWLGKLREDAREAEASISVLITQALPKEIETFGVMERVFVSLPAYALPLAVILRGSLIRIANAKISTAHKDEKLELLFKYLSSDAFMHRFEAQVENIVGLKNNLEMEKRSMKRIWKQRDVHIERLMNNAANMYGELQGIAGQEVLPTIKNLELPSGEGDEDE